MGRDAKHKEGQASALGKRCIVCNLRFSTFPLLCPDIILTRTYIYLGSASPWDKDHRAMTSKEVSDTVVVPKPGTDRLGHAAVRKATT